MGKLHRKLVTKKLSTGHEITMVATDVKMLRHAFDYMAGFVKRKSLLELVQLKLNEVNELQALLGKNWSPNQPPSPEVNNSKPFFADEDNGGDGGGVSGGGDDDSALVIDTDATTTTNTNSNTDNKHVPDLRTEDELLHDKFYEIKEELRVLEEKHSNFEKQEHKISVIDLDEILKGLGVPHSQKAIDFMLWEVDEHGDNMIDWDEFQLTYWRNINAKQGSKTEPCNFFNILEFVLFDGQKGFIIEDDVMEILFTRYGPARLEQELQFIFGNKLRSRGGEGTTTLNDYLSAVLLRTGKRAIPILA